MSSRRKSRNNITGTHLGLCPAVRRIAQTQTSDPVSEFGESVRCMNHWKGLLWVHHWKTNNRM